MASALAGTDASAHGAAIAGVVVPTAFWPGRVLNAAESGIAACAGLPELAVTAVAVAADSNGPLGAAGETVLGRCATSEPQVRE